LEANVVAVNGRKRIGTRRAVNLTAGAVIYNDMYDNPNVTASSFTLPFPTMDVVFNGKMASDAEPENIDIRATYSYDF
jgi:hypothetical protein